MNKRIRKKKETMREKKIFRMLKRRGIHIPKSTYGFTMIAIQGDSVSVFKNTYPVSVGKTAMEYTSGMELLWQGESDHPIE